MIRLVESPRTFSLPGVAFEALASPRTGSQENSAWIVVFEPGASGAPHAVTREEIFVALEGTATVTCGDERRELPAGSALIVPANTTFSIENRGADVFKAVAVLPVGGQAVLGDGTRLAPLWAQ